MVFMIQATDGPLLLLTKTTSLVSRVSWQNELLFDITITYEPQNHTELHRNFCVSSVKFFGKSSESCFHHQDVGSKICAH